MQSSKSGMTFIGRPSTDFARWKEWINPIPCTAHSTPRCVHMRNCSPQKNSRTTSASRTRQKLKRTSAEQCLEDWALGQTPTMGFNLLVENGMADLTAEYLVLKHSGRFSPQAVAAAQARLVDCGVT